MILLKPTAYGIITSDSADEFLFVFLQFPKLVWSYTGDVAKDYDSRKRFWGQLYHVSDHGVRFTSQSLGSGV